MTCPYRVQSPKKEKNALYIKSKKCSKEAGKYGFCEEHAYCHDFLLKGEALGFPEIQIGALILGATRPQWEHFACFLAAPGNPRHGRIMRALDERISEFT